MELERGSVLFSAGGRQRLMSAPSPSPHGQTPAQALTLLILAQVPIKPSVFYLQLNEQDLATAPGITHGHGSSLPVRDPSRIPSWCCLLAEIHPKSHSRPRLCSFPDAQVQRHRCGRSLSQNHQHPHSLCSPRPPPEPATGTASTPGAGTGRTEPHLTHSCFSVARFCELGVYWSKSHSAASEAGEEIKIWAVLTSSQTSGCTHRCLGLRLRSSPAWPPAPTCAMERGEEGGQMGNIFIRAPQHSSCSRT